MDDAQKARLMAEITGDAVPFGLPQADVNAPESVGVGKLMAERLDALLGPELDRLRKRVTGEDKPIALPDWPKLAEGLGGGLRAGCHVLTGGTGSGKSQVALQLAYLAAQAKIPTRYVALELDALGLVARLLCLAERAQGGPAVWWSDFYNGRASADSLQSLRDKHADDLSELPLFLSTKQGAGGWSYKEIGPAVAELRAAYPTHTGPVLLVVDFLQLLGGDPTKREDLRERIGAAAYEARQAARNHDAAVLLLSSTARGSYAQLHLAENGSDSKGPAFKDGRPTTEPAALVGIGKESGEIEYAADTALVLARGPADPDAVWLAIAKQRTGGTGWFRLAHDCGWYSEAACAVTNKPKRGSAPTWSDGSMGGGYG